MWPRSAGAHASLPENAGKQSELRAKWSILCGRCGLPSLQWVYSMTASEANRQRVLTLLRVEREQMSAEFNNFFKESLAMNQGEWSPSDTKQLSTELKAS